MNHWEAIQSVTSGPTLVAFVVAAALSAFLAFVALHVDLKIIPRADRAALARLQIKVREGAFLLMVILFGSTLAVIALVLVFAPINKPHPKVLAADSISKTLLLGHDAAIAIVKSASGSDATQEMATVNERLDRLNLDVEFPKQPLRDKAPAVAFAEQVSGRLEARDPRLARAFKVGWAGVIKLRGGGLPPAFSISSFASQAGFDLIGSPVSSDEELLNWLVEKARQEV